MVKLYIAEISALPDPKETSWTMRLLSSERQKRVLQYGKPGDRKRCLGAGLLLRKVLPLYGVNVEEIRTSSDGKPIVKGIGFNVSHSDNMVACAVGDGAVGCDVEKITEAPDGIAAHFFHPNEVRYLKACEEQASDRNFFRIWTMKESYTKMTGEGLKLPLDRFEVRPEDGEARILRGNRLLPCGITEYRIMDYLAAVCANEPRSRTVTFLESLL